MHLSAEALTRNTLRHLVAILAAVAPMAALAHTGAGHVTAFMQGVQHPFTGIDHLLAMIAVGLLAGRLGGRAMWLVPASFVSAVAAGAAFGMAGVPVPFVEVGIAASIVVFGLLLARGRDLTLPATMLVVGCFALFHGHAHGTEAVGRDISSLGYVAGMLLATTLLHAFGVLLASAACRHRLEAAAKPLLRWSGGLVALAGVGVLAGWI